MEFVVKIETNNAAFGSTGFERDEEVCRVLRKLANDIEDGHAPTTLFDINGNGIGMVRWMVDA